MLKTTIVLVLIGVWFLIAVAKGIDDQKRGLSFWKRPALLLSSWTLAVLSCLTMWFAYKLAGYAVNYGLTLLAVFPVGLLLWIGFLGTLVGFAFSFFVVWKSVKDLRDL